MARAHLFDPPGLEAGGPFNARATLKKSLEKKTARGRKRCWGSDVRGGAACSDATTVAGRAHDATGCVAATLDTHARLTAGACGHGMHKRMALRRARGRQEEGRHASDRFDSLRAAGATKAHLLPN